MSETSFERIREAAAAKGLRFKENRQGDAMMQCPVHTPDNTPSVHITYDAGGGRTLVADMHDLGKDGTEAIVHELGLSLGDLYDMPAVRGERPARIRELRDIGEGVRAMNRFKAHDAALASSWKTCGTCLMPERAPIEETITDEMTRVLDVLGWSVNGPLTCPVCGEVGAGHFAPVCDREFNGLLVACTSCKPRALYEYLKDRRITATRMSVSDTHVFVTDTTHGFAAVYADGLTVWRKGDGNGGKCIRQEGANKGGRHVPYLLAQSVPYAKMTGTIFITEGEKDAAALFTAGYPAISTTGGGGNVRTTLDLDKTVTALAGLDVVAVCDRDATGGEWRQALHDLLAPRVGGHGLKSLTFVTPRPPCHDAGDAVALGMFEFDRLEPAPVGQSASPQAEGDDTSDDERPSFADRDEFWQQTPYLRAVCEAARASRVSPMAVLAIVLVRVSVMLPPQVVAPAFIGSRPGSLNLFVAVLGASGDGKGTAASVAADLVPDLFGARTEKPSSGESLAALFTKWESEENPTDAKKPVCYHACANPRALVDVPEVTWLGAVAERKGSTVGGELASAFVGEPLGGVTKDMTKTLTTPGHGYRLGLLTGVQYANADALFNMSGTGIPQRILWVDTVDPNMPKTAPPRTPDTFKPLVDRAIVPDLPERLADLYRAGSMANMIDGGATWPWIEMRYPPEVSERTDLIRYERNEAKKRGEDDGDDLAGHLNFVRIKIAALLAWLDGSREDHTQVTSEDWTIAGQIVEYSCRVRDKCRERYWQTVRANRAEHETVRRGAQDDAERRLAEDRRATPEKISRFLTAPKRRGIPFRGIDIWRGVNRRHRPYVYDALGMMLEAGEVECVTDTGSATTSLWCAAD